MMTRLVSGVALLPFVMSILVQYNDPDGLLWMLIYAFPAGMALAGVFGAVEFIALPTSGIYLAGAALLMPWADLGQLGEYLSAWHMKNSNAEYAREALGLFICAAYLEFMGIMWVLNRRSRPAATEGN